MTDKQTAKQNMLMAVIQVLNENETVYASVPAFVKTVGDLKVAVQEIENEEKLQSNTAVKGAKNEKDEAEATLVALTVMIANALWVLAADTANTNLLPKVKVTKSMMYQTHNSETTSIARRILAEARTHIEALAPYGIVAETVDGLETAIARFESLIAAPRTAIVESKQVTTNIARLFALTDTLLNDRLDKLMSLFKQSSPDFYAVYFDARNIINTSVRHRRQPSDGNAATSAGT